MDEYTEHLGAIQQMFPNKAVLTGKEVQAYTGRSYEWVRDHLKANRGCTVIQLAKKMAKLK